MLPMTFHGNAAQHVMNYLLCVGLILYAIQTNQDNTYQHSRLSNNIAQKMDKFFFKGSRLRSCTAGLAPQPLGEIVEDG